MSINERFMDFQVAQQIRWIRLMNREVREALKILNRVDAQLAQALRNADLDGTPYTQARLNALRAQVAEMIVAIHAQLAPVLMDNVREASIAAAEIEQQAFSRIMPAGVDVTTPNIGVLQTQAELKPFNGAFMTDWITQLRDNDLGRTWRHIQDGIISGTPTEDIIRSLNGTRSLGYKDGLRQVTKRGITALVRTSINHATNQGRQAVWEANDKLLKGVRWVATLDTKTTPICRDRDGKIGPVSNDPDWRVPDGAEALDPPFARPPAHPNCRSTTVAVVKSWKELGFDVEELPEGTRASMDGQVPARTTYYEWLNRQSKDTQEEALGPTRLKLWKEGGVAPDRFQNDEGHYFTLAELKRKTPKAFKDAGL
jgi:SPP1 gp7 family putative phage head morphogenesis protein